MEVLAYRGDTTLVVIDDDPEALGGARIVFDDKVSPPLSVGSAMARGYWREADDETRNEEALRLVAAALEAEATEGNVAPHEESPEEAVVASAATQFVVQRFQANADGAMVALYPRPDEAEALVAAVAGEGVDPATVHLTLALLTDDAAAVPPELRERYAQTIAAGLEMHAVEHGDYGLPLAGEVTAVSRFGGPDGPVVALADVLGLSALRHCICMALEMEELPYAEDHDFVPHLTMSYDTEVDLPERAVGLPLSFEQVDLVWAEDRTPIEEDAEMGVNVKRQGEDAEAETTADDAAEMADEAVVDVGTTVEIPETGEIGVVDDIVEDGEVTDDIRGVTLDGSPEDPVLIIDLTDEAGEKTGETRAAMRSEVEIPVVEAEAPPEDEEPGFASEDESQPTVHVAVRGEGAPRATGDGWSGVLVVEGVESGDRRLLAEGSLDWRELPLPLMLQTQNPDFGGHAGAVVAGNIANIVRDSDHPEVIRGAGLFDSGDDGQEAMRLIDEGTIRGVSIDVDRAEVEMVCREEDGEGFCIDELVLLTGGRIMGATITPFPAFEEAFIEIAGEEARAALVASCGCEPEGQVVRIHLFASIENGALVASMGSDPVMRIPVAPPLEWFNLDDTQDQPGMTITDEGRIYGYAAMRGSCHLGGPAGRCVPVPASPTHYRRFNTASVKTVDGHLVRTGPLFMDTVHPNLRLKASDAQAHYADTGCAVADVHVGDDGRGVWFAGALRPSVTPEQVRALRGSELSPDWRRVDGSPLDLVAMLAVNASGFVVEGLAASAGAPATAAHFNAEGEVEALVAVGGGRRPSIIAELRNRIEVLENDLLSRRAQELKSRVMGRP